MASPPYQPIAPFSYEPDPADEPAENATCLDHANCLHTGNCEWPECHSHKKKKKEPVYDVPGIHYARQWAETLIAAHHQPAATGSIPAIQEGLIACNSPEEVPESTGSIPAIITSQNITNPAANPVTTIQPKDEATGSNSAILHGASNRIDPSGSYSQAA
jgi:hypothetical protein